MKYVELRRMKADGASFELHSVADDSEGSFDRLAETYWSKEKQSGKLLQTTKWQMKREAPGQHDFLAEYKVKVYHMNDDEFRVKMYPQSYYDACIYLWFNRSFFRIL